MRICRLAVMMLLAIGCQKPTHVLTSVTYIPPQARSLAVLATADGRATTDDPQPLPLEDEPAPNERSLLLTTSDDSLAQLQIAVAAFDQPGGTGCILAVGAATVELVRGANLAQISLSPVMHQDCSGTRPLLFEASPRLGSTSGGEVKLLGWGFKPDSRVRFADRDFESSLLSPAELLVRTPPHPGIGAATIRVENPDGRFDARGDLFRFYAETPSFARTDLDPGAGFITPDFVTGPFSPGSHQDLAIVMSGAPSTVRFIAIAAGLIQPALTRDFTVGNNASAPVAADFDKDGDLDLVIAVRGMAQFQLLRNDGSGNFQVEPAQPAAVVGPATNAEIHTAAGDLNGDGVPDLVITSADYTTPGSTGGVQILLNNGSGTSWTPSSLLGGFAIRAPAIADIDYDSQPDIILAAQYPSKQVLVLLNQGQGLFTNSANGSDVVAVPTSGTGMDVATYDSDGNGYPDILVSVPMSSFGLPRVSVIENNGALQIKPYDLIASARTGPLRLADLNGDNLPDLMTTADADGLGVFLSRAETGIREAQPQKHATGCAMNAQNFVAADFDQDGRTDLAVQAMGCFKLLLNQSN